MKTITIIAVLAFLGSAQLEAVGGGRGRRASLPKGGPDIMGLKLGMSFAEARAVLEQRAAKEGGQVRAVEGRPNMAAQLGYTGASQGGTRADSLGARFIVGLDEVVSIGRFKNDEIDKAGLLADLARKYGRPALETNRGIEYSSHYYAYDSNGRPTAFPASCEMVASRITSALHDQPLCPEVDSIVVVEFVMSPTAGVAKQFKIALASRASNVRAQQAQQDFKTGRKNQQDQQAKDAAQQNKTNL